MGGRTDSPGISGVHTHMSNTRNTPVEAIEHYLPVRIRRYGLRARAAAAPGVSGRRRDRPGIRDADADRRSRCCPSGAARRPYGAAGGAPGARAAISSFGDGVEEAIDGKVWLTWSPATGSASNRPAVAALARQRRTRLMTVRRDGARERGLFGWWHGG